MEAYSLFEVNQYIRRVIALNFEEAIWVECEINQISQTRGNTYLELIQKKEDSDDILAKASGTLWYRQLSFIRKKLGKVADEVLSPGIKVKIKCNIDFSERYGLSFNIIDLDPSYTFGQYELNRQQIIKKLEENDLIARNSLHDLPLVIKNIAVISSETAAGYQDFIEELFNNSYGYSFEVDIFQAAMQGQNTEREVMMALDTIDPKSYDLICIVRGGGSKLDLSAFDNYNIAERIANASLPVFTGIGHDIDQTICDIVSHTTLKTPTAVATYIVEHNMDFETAIDQMMAEIIEEVYSNLNDRKYELQMLSLELQKLPKMMITEKYYQLEGLLQSAGSLVSARINMVRNKLQSNSEIIKAYEPSNVLKKGYVLMKSEKDFLKSKAEFDSAEGKIEIEFFDGKSEINK